MSPTEEPWWTPQWGGRPCPYCGVGVLRWNPQKGRYECPRCHPQEKKP